jgi:hypothetical protein
MEEEMEDFLSINPYRMEIITEKERRNCSVGIVSSRKKTH